MNPCIAGHDYFQTKYALSELADVGDFEEL